MKRVVSTCIPMIVGSDVRSGLQTLGGRTAVPAAHDLFALE
jgi:hypothetical protein